MKILPPSPYVPKNPLLPVVGEHNTFVQTIAAPGVTLEATELDRVAASLWRLVHDLDHTRTHPLSVAALRDLLRQAPHRPHRVHIRSFPNAMPTNGQSEEGFR